MYLGQCKIDRSIIVDAYNGQFEELTDINWQYTGFYTDMFARKYPYDYRKARDLMREEGYWAREEAILKSLKIQGIQTEITVPGDTPIDSFSILLGLLVFVQIKKRKN